MSETLKNLLQLKICMRSGSQYGHTDYSRHYQCRNAAAWAEQAFCFDVLSESNCENVFAPPQIVGGDEPLEIVLLGKPGAVLLELLIRGKPQPNVKSRLYCRTAGRRK